MCLYTSRYCSHMYTVLLFILSEGTLVCFFTSLKGGGWGLLVRRYKHRHIGVTLYRGVPCKELACFGGMVRKRKTHRLMFSKVPTKLSSGCYVAYINGSKTGGKFVAGGRFTTIIVLHVLLLMDLMFKPGMCIANAVIPPTLWSMYCNCWDFPWLTCL